jgi:iron complex outermembrane recepter protein
MLDRREHKMKSIKNWIVSVLSVVLESHLRKPGDKNISDRGVFVRVAAFLGLCVFSTASDPTRAQSAVSDQSAALDEIVVTAGRREEKAQDYAGALQVISGVDLEKSGANGFVDYLLSIPSASFRDQGNGSIRIGLRGVSNIAGSDFGAISTGSPVGLYLDDVPIDGTSVLPDLSLYDVNRIEVLKGPQGTLYGAGAMGGALRMMTNQPDLQHVSATTELSGSGTDGGGFNRAASAALNAPLIENTLALRLVASYRNDDGFVNNVATGQNDWNPTEAHSVRGTLAFQPSEAFSADLLLMGDEVHQYGASQSSPALGGLQIDSPEPLFSDNKFSLYALTLKGNLGFADLTSVTSYNKAEQEMNVWSPMNEGFFGGMLATAFNLATYSPATINSHSTTDSTSEELRLVSHGDTQLSWIAGAFVRDKKYNLLGLDQLLTDSQLASIAAYLGAHNMPPPNTNTNVINSQFDEETYKQRSLYGEATFEITKQLKLTGGLRWYNEKDDVNYASTDPSHLLRTNAFLSDASGTNDGVLPKLSASYQFTSDHLAYATVSEGYRSGGPNTAAHLFGVGQAIVPSDKLWNYEIGAKTAWLERQLIVNASVYYVDWQRIQAFESAYSPVLMTVVGFLGNGGNGTIKGAELEIQGHLTNALSIGANAGYAHSELVSSNAGAIIGQPLPNSPEWTASGLVDYRFPLSALGTGFLHYDISYVDSQTSELLFTPTDDVRLHSYSLSNVRVGVDARNDLTVAVFADNLFNDRAELGRDLSFGNAADNTHRFTIARPRTIGVRLNKKF